MVYLGVDYGQKRIGLSYSDEVGIALPLEAAVQDSESDRLLYIQDLIKKYRVQVIVLGYPYSMNGELNQKTKEVDAFLLKLKALTSLPVYTVDERLTTHMALSYSKKKLNIKESIKERKSGILDSRAATIILQDFLDQRSI